MKAQINTFGDTRQLILQTIQELRAGTMDISRGLAVAANMKVLNDNINAEINAAKLCLLAKKEGHEFGRVMRMGTQYIGSNAE